MTVHFQADSAAVPANLDGLLRETAEAALRHQGAPPQAELSLVLGDDAQLRDLNYRHLGIDAPTDVLSFPAEATDPESGAPYLGDVVISVERAAKQALRAGHSLEAELQLLVVHGVLHLLGHDHADPEPKAAMWAAQADILHDLGVELDLAALDQLEPHH